MVFGEAQVKKARLSMKVNSMMVVVAVAIVGVTSGCNWHDCGSCKNSDGKCCDKPYGVGVKADGGCVSADAGISSSDMHVGAKLGK
jgi:hypothetical protein